MTEPIAAKTAETGMTALFIRRPVLAFVLNTLIAVAQHVSLVCLITIDETAAQRERLRH